MPEAVKFYCATCLRSRKFVRDGQVYRCEVCGRIVYPREVRRKHGGGEEHGIGKRD